MLPLTSLWSPVLLSAAVVFVASSIIHMVLPFHRSDYSKVPHGDDVMEELHKIGIPPGDYVIPCPASPKEMKSPDFVDKADKGPVAFLTVGPNGVPSMRKSPVLWLIYCAVVGFIAAYVAGRALHPFSTIKDLRR